MIKLFFSCNLNCWYEEYLYIPPVSLILIPGLINCVIWSLSKTPIIGCSSLFISDKTHSVYCSSELKNRLGSRCSISENQIFELSNHS